ncbi:putative FMN-dependent luciferase-like monooxygenase [Roseomonas sp. HJA6]|uniref:FMN-dependent luciferase-like monooxygenase n=1 Tax=Roseomonas alba TaxID=2846776 RepID=A0ABS7A707_9PROT|nr:putative FMN-dependent luciferase-like monooxygenase [Neoroseomonas alba]MBW6398092.1 putative FMN-dependent luciferase-like monooxygenase [Neoroseomonas alba]
MKLGFFTRVLDEGSAAERYRCALAQIRHAEAQGFDSAWVAQHHFHEFEGGLPSPFVLLAQAAALTSRIRLATGIVTLPMEMPIRVAEDAIVLDLISNGRLELGVGSGGNPEAFAAFGLKDADRRTVFAEKLDELLGALRGDALKGGDHVYPSHPALLDRMWYATFSVDGSRTAGKLGMGLLLSRTQPRTKEAPDATLADIQDPMVDAYLEALPKGVAPRILASRSVFATDRRDDAMRFAEIGLQRYHKRLVSLGRVPDAPRSTEEVIRRQDVHLGTVEEVIASLKADRVMDRATELAVQVHSIDPPHPFVLRSIELVAEGIAPAFGWKREEAAAARAA